MPPLLLILDIDETLIHTTDSRPDNAPGFAFEKYWITPRPHVGEFLQKCQTSFQLAVWSAGTERYVASIVSQIFPKPDQLKFVWSRECCTLVYDPGSLDRYYRKELRKITQQGFVLERTLIVDDCRSVAERNHGNFVPIKPFEGDKTDAELPRLWPYLEKWAAVPDVRTIEKRHWHWQPDWLSGL